MGSPRKLLAVVAMGASLLALTALGAATPPAQTQKEGAGSCCNQAKPSCCANGAHQSAQQTALIAAHRNEDAAKASPESLAKGVATRKALLAQVGSLMEDGVADCCIGPGCVMCPIAADGCGCSASLSKGGPVCPECWGGWQAGQGGIPGIKPESVKILPTDVLKKVYGMKADKIKEASK